MKYLKTFVAVALISTAGVFALPSIAFAGSDEQLSAGGSTDFYRSMVTQYRDYIARMTPENRAKAMAMHDKVMQMEMEMKSMEMKMSMDLAKVKRDLELFILTNGR